MGVDVLGGKVDNLMELFVWEPEIVRINVLTAATEANRIAVINFILNNIISFIKN
jgi:chaperonin GroEL (HSP60 family)